MTGTRALIHLENLKHNIGIVRRRVGKECKICLPVKANAYGHGMIPLASAALKYGCHSLAVARTDEGEKLRKSGINCPILVMGHVPLEELERLVRLDLQPYAGSLSYLEALQRAAEKVLPPGKQVSVHLKIDTGMGRIGCKASEAPGLAQMIFASSRLKLIGLCTHFPVSDSPAEEDRAFTEIQTETLLKTAQTIGKLPGSEKNGPFSVHGANSGAVAQHDKTALDMVRPGIILYGYEPLPLSPLGVRPLMELQSELVFLKKIAPGQSVSYGRTWTAERETWIGTVAIGYGDGYNRKLSNCGKVMIGGRVYPVIGRVCMDQIMVDLGSECQARLGDRVSLFGPPPCPFSAAQVAERLDTISYEVCCLITDRVPREYVE
ncbi:MAG: alanine racemase [Spirochaetales bacterium]|nr:alanine racemase [Spirochaetales bacterium]